MMKNMEIKEYQQLALRTFNSKDFNTDLLHITLGMVTEASEFADVIKKHIAYGKPLDMANLKEEAGDLLWFTVVGLHVLGFDIDDTLATNIKKLEVRYPEKYSDLKALNRDLETERTVLEQKNN